MDENKPSHLASTAVVAVVFGALTLLLYAYQQAQLVAGTGGLYNSVLVLFMQGSLALIVLGFGFVAFTLGFISRLSTSRGFPDFLPSLWSMLLGIFLMASPVLTGLFVSVISKIVQEQNFDLNFVLYFTLGLVALILIVVLVIIGWSNHVIKNENKTKKLEKQRARSEKKHQGILAKEKAEAESIRASTPAYVSQNAVGAPEPTPPTNWNGFPNA